MDLEAAPPLDAATLQALGTLGRQDRAVYDYLAARVGRWVCRECCGDFLAETAGARPGQFAGVVANLRRSGWTLPRSKMMTCVVHGNRRSHDRLDDVNPTGASRLRVAYTPAERRRIIAICGGRDAYTGEYTGLEADHRLPQVRWEANESRIDLTDEDAVRGHFQPLTAVNNKLKSRACEGCVRTGERPAFMGLKIHFVGDSTFDERHGCNGCGWAYPEQWRAYVQEAVSLLEETT